MRGHSIVIFATILLASRTARAQFAIGSDIEIDPPAVRPDAGAPGNREHDLRLATVGTTVLASWLDNRVDADEEIRFVRLAQDGHPLDTAASAVPSSRSARHVRTAGGGHSFLVAFLYASQFDRGSTTAMGYRIREDGVLDPEAFSIGSAALEFNHGFLDVGAAWDGDAFITAAVEAWSVTATSYSEGRRIPPSGEPTPTAVPDPQSVFAMQSNDTATIYAYDAPDPGSTSSRAFFISVSGVATRVLDVLPRAIGIATRSSEFVVAVPGHTWQFADYGRLLHHTTTPIPNASELPIAAAGSGYVLAWSTRAPTGDWEIRVSRMTRDGELVEPDGVPLITALRDEPHPVLCATADTGLLLGYERFDDGPLFGTTRVRVRRFSIVAPITEADMRDAETPDDVPDAAADIVDEATVPPRRLGCGCRTTSNRRTRVSWLTLIAASIALRRRKTKTHG